MFEGTIQSNLDPTDVFFTSDQIWKALELSHLSNHVLKMYEENEDEGVATALDVKLSEGGSNLSVGQRQLMCLARALLIASNDSPSSANQKTPKPKKYKKREKLFHPAANFSPEPSNVPAYQQPKAQSIKEMLEEVKQGALFIEEEGCDNSDGDGAQTGTISHQGETNKHTDNLPAALKAYLRTPEQRQAEVDEVKAESRLRWLAFYYLSRREYGKAELQAEAH